MVEQQIASLDERRRAAPAVVMGDLTLVRPLVMAGIPVVVATTDPRDVTLRSRFVKQHCLLPGFATDRAEASAALLCDLGRRLFSRTGGRAPIIYGSDPALDFMYRFREPLSRWFLFLLNDDELGAAMLDKARFGELARERGVLSPATFTLAEVRAGRVPLDAPVLVKPVSKLARARVPSSLLGPAEKAHVFPEAQQLLARSSSLGSDNLYSFHGFADREANVLASFCGRKIRAYPPTTGDSAFIELADNDALTRWGHDAIARLGVAGVFKIDVLWDRATERFYAIELNARFNLWHYLGAKHGVNLPLVACEYLTSGKLPARAPYLPRYRWVSLYRDYKGLGQRPDLTRSAWLLSLLRGPNLYEVFDWRDPAPALWWAAGFAAGKARRWRSTAS
jgi:predicted ATP-grasp superfamily ATP-dependent carboligase